MFVPSAVQVLQPSQKTDQSLLRRFQSGDQEAAAALYRRYAARVKALVKAQSSPELAKCLESDDLTQSVFGAFFKQASDGYYAVPAGEDLWGLLLVITLNKIRDKHAFYSAAKRDAGVTVSSREFEKFIQSKK